MVNNFPYLGQCLRFIRDYENPEHSDMRPQFLSQILSIPDLEKHFEFQKEENPNWVELVGKVDAQFYLRRLAVSSKEDLPANKLSLVIFNNGKIPVIRVTTYFSE